MTRMFVYELPPIDDWGGWTALDEVPIEYEPLGEGNFWSITRAELKQRWQVAKAIARRIGWEGDVRQGPFVCPLPAGEDSSCGYLIAWKQGNNGTTFIASMVALPWLQSTCDASCSREIGIAEARP